MTKICQVKTLTMSRNKRCLGLKLLFQVITKLWSLSKYLRHGALSTSSISLDMLPFCLLSYCISLRASNFRTQFFHVLPTIRGINQYSSNTLRPSNFLLLIALLQENKSIHKRWNLFIWWIDIANHVSIEKKFEFTKSYGEIAAIVDCLKIAVFAMWKDFPSKNFPSKRERGLSWAHYEAIGLNHWSKNPQKE